MSIVNSHVHRAQWLSDAGKLLLAIEDLRSEITIALQQPQDTLITIALAEADQDLADARAAIHVASSKVAAIR